MAEVFVLWHVHPETGDPEPELIGIYTSEQLAVDAARRLADQPGFREYPTIVADPSPDEGGFQLTEYVLNQDHWLEGHVPGDSREG